MKHTPEKTVKDIICAVVDNGTAGIRLSGSITFNGEKVGYIRFTKLHAGGDKPTGEVAVCVNNSSSISRVQWESFVAVAELVAPAVIDMHSILR